MKHKLHFAYANREDLLKEAVESARDIGHIHLWPNNGAKPVDDITDVTYHQLPDMAPVGVINMMIQSSWDDDVMFWMHNDGLAKPGIADDFKHFVLGIHEHHKSDWGVIFSLYDILCAFNMKAVRAVGYWDPMFFQYTADMDYYHRLTAAGFPSIQYGPGRDGVEHRGSMTVRSNHLFNHITQWREGTRFDKKYYAMKWGGDCSNEKFARPFQNFIPKEGLVW